MTVCRLPLVLAALLCGGALHAGSLEIIASVDRADLAEVEAPGRHRILPDLTLRLSLSADCGGGSGVLSVTVADTRRSYPMATSRVDGLPVEVVVPARQLPPVPVPKDFCVVASEDPDRATVRAGLSVHASLRCRAGDTESFASRSAAVDIPLSCRRRDREDQDPAVGSSEARNSSARSQVSEASSGS